MKQDGREKIDLETIDLETLRQHSKLFSLLNEAGQERLLSVAGEQVFADGQALMREGELGRAFYVVVAGQLRVSIDDLGQPKEVARLSRGAFVGEVAALLSEPRSATVVAEGEVRCLRFEADAVEDVLREHPKVREAIVKLALKRSEDNLQQMLEMDVPAEADES